MTRPVVRRAGAALLVVLALLASGCTSVQGTEGKEYVAGDGRVVPFAPEDRDPPVKSSGTDLDGQPLDVASYRGEVLVVNVWASWCPPCRKEMPLLAEVAGALPPGTAMIGINSRDSEANAQAFLRNTPVPYPSLNDEGGTALLDFSDELGGPEAFPSTMILDRQGRLARLVLGEVPSARTLLDVVDDVLAEPDAQAAPATPSASTAPGTAG